MISSVTDAVVTEVTEWQTRPLAPVYPVVFFDALRVKIRDEAIPFFAFPPEVRRVIYTTNAIESINARVRKIIKTRGHFPNDESATKLIWLALRNITATWSRAAHGWKAALNQFAILYEDRLNRGSASNGIDRGRCRDSLSAVACE